MNAYLTSVPLSSCNIEECAELMVMLSLRWTVILPMECKGHFEVFIESSWPGTTFLLLFELDESQAQCSP